MPQPPEALRPAPTHLQQGHAPVKGTCDTCGTDDVKSVPSEGRLFSVYPPLWPVMSRATKSFHQKNEGCVPQAQECVCGVQQPVQLDQRVHE